MLSGRYRLWKTATENLQFYFKRSPLEFQPTYVGAKLDFKIPMQRQEHFRALSQVHGEDSLRILPTQLDPHPFAPTIVERAAVVFIEQERSVCAGKDGDRKWRIGLFLYVLL